jgi:serine/threonine-protein kinase
MENLIGETLGQYRITAKIGQGATASVFKAHQSTLDRDVALKVLPPSFAAKNPIFVERFEREAKSIARLHHPNIVPIYDFGVDKDYSYIVMRYVEGAQTLFQLMCTSLDMDRVIDLISQVAAALDYAHQNNIIHRDVKPSNILLDGKWALLSDFGLAKIIGVESRLTDSGFSIGTPAYTSPEQARGEDVDHRTDIYALGVILYEILTGDIPHNAETPLTLLLKRATQPPLPPRSLNPNISISIEQVILRALDPDPENRYYSAGDFVEALKQAVADETYRDPFIDSLDKQTLTFPTQSATEPRVPGDTSESKPALPSPVSQTSLPAWKRLTGGLNRFSVAAGLGLISLVIIVFILWSRNNFSFNASQTASTQTAPGIAVAPTPTPTPQPTATPLLATDTPVPTPVIKNFTVNPPEIVEGESVTIVWDVAGADTVSIEPIGANLPPAQSLVQWPTETTFYVLTATYGSAKTQAVFQQVLVKPAPTNTPLPADIPALELPTATATPTPSPTATLAPTSTLAPPTPTPTPEPLEGNFASLDILNPDHITYGPTDFEWEWFGPTPPNAGFEIRVWRDGHPPLGAHDSLLDNQQGRIRQVAENKYQLSIDISQAAGVQGRSGEYLWTVVLVQTAPAYADLGIQADPAMLTFAAPGSGGSSSDGDDKGPSGGGIK